MTQKTVLEKENQKKFDANALKEQLLKDYQKLPKEHLLLSQEIQAEFKKYLPKDRSLADELLAERKKHKT